jgi:hypothetical protein
MCGFQDVRGRARGKCRVDVGVVVVHGEDDDAKPRLAFPRVPKQRDAVDLAVCHLDSRNQEIGTEFVQEVEGFRRGRRLPDDLNVDPADHLRNGVQPQWMLVHQHRSSSV